MGEWEINLPQTIKLFRSFMESYPHLKMELREDDPNVGLVMYIPEQPGLKFEIHVYLDNGDELGIGAGEFYHCTWFPCDDVKKREEYISCVHGLLNGNCRILEYFRNKPNQCSHASLEALKDGQWVKISGWANLLPWIFKRGKKITELRNV